MRYVTHEYSPDAQPSSWTQQIKIPLRILRPFRLLKVYHICLPTPQSLLYMVSDPPKFIIYVFQLLKVYHIYLPTPQSLLYMVSDSSKYIL